MADNNFSALFRAELDVKSLEKQVDALRTREFKLSNFKVETASLISQIQSELSKHKFDINVNPVKMSGDMQSAGTSAANSFAKGFQSGLSGIKGQVKITANTIDELRTSLSKVGVDRGSIGNITKDLETLDIAIKRITSTEKGKNIRFNITGLDKAGNIVTTFREIEAETGKLVSSGTSLTQSFDAGERAATKFASTMRSALDLKGSPEKMEATIASIRAEYDRLGTTGHQKLAVIGSDIERLSVLQEALKGKSGKELVTTYEEWAETLARVKSNLNTVNAETKGFATSLQVKQFDNQMISWMSQNTRASKQFGETVRRLRTELNNMSAAGTLTKQRLAGLKTEFAGVKAQAQQLGLTGKSFMSTFSQSFSAVSRYVSAAQLIYRAIHTIKEMYKNVLEVDTAMTGLYRVTNMTESQYSSLYSNMTASAQKYGSTLKDIIDLTTSWVKLGYDANTALDLAGITTTYQHVTDIDTETATKHLITAYKGFQDELNQTYQGNTTKAVEYVSDIYDKLNNEFAVTASDIGNAMQRSASALSLAGNTIQQSTGMATGMVEVIQNAEKAGTVLQTTSLRLRGMKGELEDLGEEVDDDVKSLSNMQTHILNLTHGKVNIFGDNDEHKSTYQILKEIANVYDSLKETEQADLLETVAGKRNANGVAAIIKNWSKVEEATKAATNAEGTAAKENETFMNSMQGKINATQASWQAFSNSFMSSDFLKGFIDSGNTALKVLQEITKTLGTIPTLILAIATALKIRSIS